MRPDDLRTQQPVTARFLAAALLGSAVPDVVGKLAFMVATVTAARSLEPSSFGQFVGLLAAAVMASALWDVGLTTVLSREVGRDRSVAREAIGRVLSIRLFLGPLWLLAYVSGVLLVSHDQPGTAGTVVLVGCVSLVSGISSVLAAALRGLLQFRAAGSAIALGRCVTALISVALAVASRHDTEAFAAAAAAGEASTLLIAALAFGHSAPAATVTTRRIRDLIGLRSGAPFAANSLLATIYNRFDVVVLSALSSTRELGLYAPASRLQDMLYFIPATLGSVVLPIVARSQGYTHTSRQETRSLVSRTIGIGLAIALPTTALVVAVAPELLTLVVGAKYSDSALPVRVLSLFLPLAVIQAPILAALAATGRARETTEVFALAFGVAIAGHIVLDPSLGALGASIASLSRDIAAVLLCLFLARRHRLI
jgi:O-antigen/teichoic acid export membrane protein